MAFVGAEKFSEFYITLHYLKRGWYVEGKIRKSGTIIDSWGGRLIEGSKRSIDRELKVKLKKVEGEKKGVREAWEKGVQEEVRLGGAVEWECLSHWEGEREATEDFLEKERVANQLAGASREIDYFLFLFSFLFLLHLNFLLFFLLLFFFLLFFLFFFFFLFLFFLLSGCSSCCCSSSSSSSSCFSCSCSSCSCSSCSCSCSSFLLLFFSAALLFCCSSFLLHFKNYLELISRVSFYQMTLCGRVRR